jgi:integrase
MSNNDKGAPSGAPRRRRHNGAGTAIWESGRWKAKITLADGSRVLIEMPTVPPSASKAKAQEAAAAYAERERETGKILAARRAAGTAKPDGGESIESYLKRWLAERAAQGLTSIKDDRQRARDYITPTIGSLSIAGATKLDIRRLVQALDDNVRAGEVGWKTAHHVWTLTRTMFKDACSSKRAELVVREDDPTDKVEGPDRGEQLARTYLYPSEFQKLITCKDVPVEWRRLYAMAAYTLSRAGELSALRWDAVDLERGVIHFRQATDRRTKGAVKSTKSGKARRIPIEPTLRPLLDTLLREATTANVIRVPVSKRADSLREHLELAGVRRAELFAPPKDGSVAATWAPLTFHDLRGTGVTWMALRGDEPLVIQQRAGHANFATTQRYLREAETLGRDGGVPFPPLPADLLDESSADSSEPSGPAYLPVSTRSESVDLATLETVQYASSASGLVRTPCPAQICGEYKLLQLLSDEDLAALPASCPLRASITATLSAATACR